MAPTDSSTITPVTDKPRCCVVVPAYCEGGRIGNVVRGILPHCELVVVVDDGSPDATAAEAAEAGATVLKHEVNRGKGAAQNTGFRYALEQSFDLVVTMDADGQHAPEDLAGFLRKQAETGARAVLGNRMDDPRDMPLVRRLTNRYMSWLLSRKMGQRVPDTQCGFRMYHRDVLPIVITDSERFEADSEVLLNLASKGVKIETVPVKVIYRDEQSKIRPVRDTFRFFSMLHNYANPDAPDTVEVLRGEET